MSPLRYLCVMNIVICYKLINTFCRPHYRVKEHETFSAKVEQQLALREKDISELERR